MNHFARKGGGAIHAEEVPLADIAQAVGTPFYCYSTATLERHYRVFAEAFADEYAYFYALRRGETPDAGTFDKDRCVKRLTDAGLALATAEFFANECAPMLHGQKHAPSPASAD